jgi:hypothetical protein
LPAPSDEAKQGAFESILQSVSAYAPSLICGIRGKMVRICSKRSQNRVCIAGTEQLSW